MPTTTFLHGPDWESSSGPICSRAFHIGDLWPQGLANILLAKDDAGTACDLLTDGKHPCLAIGPKAGRPNNLVGVVLTYSEGATIAEMNIAPGCAFKAYVANVLTYTLHAGPLTFDTSLAVGEPVYVDDSHSLPAGVTLSRSPQNSEAAVNPQAGYLWYDQDDYLDAGVGGPNHTADWPKTVANSIVYTLVSVLLWPDSH